ncbi:hypothetical protein GCK72_010933 [Caenorhabditis remanei]|uniref:Uncharacterized protein n=1 Tax=Caenorhabditis remanei TaxID=31234 RepID=A0A6A5H6Z9_CAERE|nr:hypothetical protein GCK72_010933 [Caenorhabditis remanei]KAF1762671.1 hypothetical protein GCK72_010933 [Caenorhabditis remanei]
MLPVIAKSGCLLPTFPTMVPSSPAAKQADMAGQQKMFPFVAPSGNFEINQTVSPIQFFPASPFLLPSVPAAPVWPMNPAALQMNFNFQSILQNMGNKLQPNQSSRSKSEVCSMDCDNEDVDVLN